MTFSALACLVYFGAGAVTASVAAVAIITGALNALLRKADSQSNALLDWIRSVLAVRQFAVASSLLFWGTALLVGGLKVSEFVATRATIKVSGFVHTKAGVLADKAAVSLTVGKFHYGTTANGGTFVFPEIHLRSPLEQATLHIDWIDPSSQSPTSVDRQVTLPLADNLDLDVTLPDSPGPLVIRYYSLSGQAIDFLLRYREVDPHFARAFGGQPFIIRNAVYDTAAKVTARFGVEFNATYLLNSALPNKFDTERDREQLASSLQRKKVFVAAKNDLPVWNFSTPTQDRIVNELKIGKEWNVTPESGKNGRFPFNLDFWRNLKATDQTWLTSETPGNDTVAAYVHMAAYLGGNSVPPGFAFCLASYEPDGCPDFESRLVPRYARLDVAVIENTSLSNLDIGTFDISEVAGSLRFSSVDAGRLRGTKKRLVPLFAQGVLKPHERLLVPIGLRFTYQDYFEEAEKEGQTEAIKFVAPPGGENLRLRKFLRANNTSIEVGLSKKTTIGHDALVAIANRTWAEPQVHEDFFYGPHISLISVFVNGKQELLRDGPVSTVAYFGGADVGSCPTVYGWTSKSAWTRFGHILTKRPNLRLAGTDYLRLWAGTNMIDIREEELETSHIDDVYIIARTDQGNRFVISPESKPRAKLHHGDVLHLIFSLPNDVVSEVLAVTGHYEREPIAKVVLRR
jgi:hypothetical protein